MRHPLAPGAAPALRHRSRRRNARILTGGPPLRATSSRANRSCSSSSPSPSAPAGSSMTSARIASSVAGVPSATPSPMSTWMPPRRLHERALDTAACASLRRAARSPAAPCLGAAAACRSSLSCCCWTAVASSSCHCELSASCKRRLTICVIAAVLSLVSFPSCSTMPRSSEGIAHAHRCASSSCCVPGLSWVATTAAATAALSCTATLPRRARAHHCMVLMAGLSQYCASKAAVPPSATSCGGRAGSCCTEG